MKTTGQNLTTLRPTSWDDFFGTIDVANIKQLLNSNPIKFPRVSLFNGIRGIGKSTAARLVAAHILGIPKEELYNFIDHLEYNGSEFMLFNIGQLNKVKNAEEIVSIMYSMEDSLSDIPNVIILEEIQKMTNEAQEIFLTVFDEAATFKNLYIICTTTEMESLIDTLKDRRFSKFMFKPLNYKMSINYINHICDKFSLKIEDKVKEDIAISGEGSPGIMSNLIEEYINNGSITSLSTNLYPYSNLLKKYVIEISNKVMENKDFSISGLNTELIIMKRETGSYEGVRIKFMFYLIKIMGKLSDDKELTYQNMVLLSKFIKILSKPLAPEPGAIGDLIGRIVEMIDLRTQSKRGEL